jgi:hypothetical protein
VVHAASRNAPQRPPRDVGRREKVRQETFLTTKYPVNRGGFYFGLISGE